MNMNCETKPAHFANFEAVGVTDDELVRIEGGSLNISGIPLLVVKVLEMIRTPPTVPVRTPPSPGY